MARAEGTVDTEYLNTYCNVCNPRDLGDGALVAGLFCYATRLTLDFESCVEHTVRDGFI